MGAAGAAGAAAGIAAGAPVCGMWLIGYMAFFIGYIAFSFLSVAQFALDSLGPMGL